MSFLAIFGFPSVLGASWARVAGWVTWCRWWSTLQDQQVLLAGAKAGTWL